MTAQDAGTGYRAIVDTHRHPVGPKLRAKMVCRLMGSPDLNQIDGLGGAKPVTSKLAIVGPSTRDDADVEYTFGQVQLDELNVDYTGNCGNISSGVGPFAIDEGLVTPTAPSTTVRIHNTNTDKILIADVPVIGGRAAVQGRRRQHCGSPGDRRTDHNGLEGHCRLGHRTSAANRTCRGPDSARVGCRSERFHRRRGQHHLLDRCQRCRADRQRTSRRDREERGTS
jgi:PrpF protein